MKTICISISLLLSLFAQSQDVLVKNDKSEMNVKVVEITNSDIKYKKWENQEGPLYNISKSAVFMIIYKNGQREIVNTAETYKQQETLSTPTTVPAAGPANSDTINLKDQKVQYTPTRFIYTFEESAAIGFQQEIGLIKNACNFGVSTDYYLVDGYTQTLYSLYVSPYLPLNRLMGNFKNQNKGLFINAKIGYAAVSVNYDGETASEGGLMYGLALDYMFSKTFGITASGFKFKDSPFIKQAGISINIF